mgnify:CR=1 FL=1
MLILALESSCDETAASVSRDGREILSNVVYSQIDMHALYGGVVPEIASRAHIEAISPCVEKAVSEAGITLSDIEAVGVTYSPGLIGCLLVGVNFAKSLAFSLGVPLIPVDHIRSHTAAAYFTDSTLNAPFLSLVVSGGHTSLYSVPEAHIYEEIGSTRDDAAGEALDKGAKLLDLGYPGGPIMQKTGEGGNIEKYHFPRPLTGTSGKALSEENRFNFSFSGIKTAVINHCHNLPHN